MASKPIDGVNYFTDFTNGNGIPLSSYTAYAPDIDTTLTTALTTMNQLVDESRAVLGPQAVIVFDITLPDETATPPRTKTHLGVASYRVSVNANPLLLDIAPGALLVGAGERVSKSTNDQIAIGGRANATDYIVAVDTNGDVFIETVADQRAYDIALVDIVAGDWDNPRQTNEYSIDADVYERMRTENVYEVADPTNPGAGPFVITPRINEGADSRMDAYGRLICGFTTDVLGNAIGPLLGGGGAAATPSLQVGSGTGAHEETGFWLESAGKLGVGTLGVARYFVLANQIRANANGTAALPFYSWEAEPDTGMRRGGTDNLVLGTGGVDGIEINASQVVNLPAQPAGSATRIGLQNIADNTPTGILCTAEDFDVTAQHDTATNPDRVTIGTDEGGVYQVSAQATFDESTGNGGAGGVAGLRRIQIAVNGTAVPAARDLRQGDGTNDPGLACAATVNVVATDYISVLATQVTGGTMDIIECRLSWSKVA